MALPAIAAALTPVVSAVTRLGVTQAIQKYGKEKVKQAVAAYAKSTGKKLRKGSTGRVQAPKDDTASMIAKDVARKKRGAKQRVATSSQSKDFNAPGLGVSGKAPATRGPRGVSARGGRGVSARTARTKDAASAASTGEALTGELIKKRRGPRTGVVAGVGAGALGGAALTTGDKKTTADKTTSKDTSTKTKTGRPSVNTRATAPKSKKPDARQGMGPRSSKNVNIASRGSKKPAASGDYTKYKSIAAAKKAGSLYYDKDGKKMAAVFKEDLGEGESLRDFMNKKLGKTRRKDLKGGGMMNTKMSTKGGMKGGGMTKGYSRGGALKKPTADQKGLQKLPTKVRNDMGYMKAGGMTKGGMKGGGMMNTKGYAKGGMSTKGGMKGGGMATKGNTKGGAKKTTGKGKVRGAGIAKRGVRPAKMR